MHILYIHQYFATTAGRTGTRSYEFARRWAQAGHRVTMVTSSAQLTEADLLSSRRGFVTRVRISGIDVIAVNVRYRQSMRTSRRLWAFLTFMLMASWFAFAADQVDVIYASSTPLTVGVPALLARSLRGRRFVFEVRDPWPAVPIALGVLRSRLAIGSARWLERTIYRKADAIVALSDGMASMVREVAPSSARIVTIPNCADTEMFHPGVDGTAARIRFRWGDRIVCIHVGAMGRVNGLDVIIRAAEHFRNDPDILFVLVGEGSDREKLMTDCGAGQVQNVRIMGPLPKHVLPEVLAAADICLMTVVAVPVLEHNSANKFFDYLSAGKPVVLNYGGWQRKLLEAAGAGVGCTLGDESEFFAAVARLKADEKLRVTMGKAARDLALAMFSRDQLSAQALKLIASVAGIQRQARRGFEGSR